MSGAYDFLMKVVARDMDHFAELCMLKILKYPGVAHVESSFSSESREIVTCATGDCSLL